jgi:hypothetical protein
MYFCEDLGMEPIMAVWAGYSFDEKNVPENGLAPYIQAAIDQINFVIGDPATNEYAALRASLGHPEPFALSYVELGNEDFFASQSYVYRWRDFAGNLTKAFPQLRLYAFDSLDAAAHLDFLKNSLQPPSRSIPFWIPFQRSMTFMCMKALHTLSRTRSSLTRISEMAHTTSRANMLLSYPTDRLIPLFKVNWGLGCLYRFDDTISHPFRLLGRGRLHDWL